MGYYLSRCDLQNNRFVNLSYNKLLVLFLIITIIFYTAEILLLTSHSISTKDYGSISQFNILNVIAVLSTFLTFRCFSESGGLINKLEPSKLGKAIYSLSICSYGIYLSHMIVKYGFYVLLEPIKSQKFIYTSLTLVLTLGCAWLLIWIMSKIRFKESMWSIIPISPSFYFYCDFYEMENRQCQNRQSGCPSPHGGHM